MSMEVVMVKAAQIRIHNLMEVVKVALIKIYYFTLIIFVS